MVNEIGRKKCQKWIQTILYAPHFLSTVIVVGLMMIFLSQENCLVNHVLVWMGFKPIAFLTNPSWFKSMYVTSGVWQQMGWNSIIYLAALAGIDPHLHESAQMDGASRLRRIWHINLPGLRPTIIILLILNMGTVLGVGFEKIYLLQNSLNMQSSDVISTHVYRSGILGAEYGFSAAVGLFNSLINFVMLVVVNAIVFFSDCLLQQPTAGTVWLWPKDLSWRGYEKLFQNKEIMQGYGNTILYTVSGTAINVALTVAAAFPLSRRNLLGRHWISGFMVFTMFFSGGLIPTYLLIKQLGLLNTYWVIPGAVSVWNIMLMRTFFQSVLPFELQEAAAIDGCSNLRILWRIVLPLSAPILAVMVLFYSVGHWNAYFNALIYLSDRDKYPLQLILREILVQGETKDMVDVSEGSPCSTWNPSSMLL